MSVTKEINDIRLAVLIDADNISHDYVDGMMQEIARYGNPTIKRIYGDWTRPNLSGWKAILLDYAISPIQQFSYTTGKNATDSAMIIEAMDILYSDKVDAYCLVSSDSDFTRLATRLREAGKTVYGIGEQKTPNAFIAACDRFIYLEILSKLDGEEGDQEREAAVADKPSDKKQDKKSTTQSKEKRNNNRQKPFQSIDKKLVMLIVQTIHDVEDENGWAYLSEVGNLLNKKQPSFDPRNYGFSKLSNMLKAINQCEIDTRDAGTGSPNSKHIFVRVKKRKRKNKQGKIETKDDFIIDKKEHVF